MLKLILLIFLTTCLFIGIVSLAYFQNIKGHDKNPKDQEDKNPKDQDDSDPNLPIIKSN